MLISLFLYFFICDAVMCKHDDRSAAQRCFFFNRPKIRLGMGEFQFAR